MGRGVTIPEHNPARGSLDIAQPGMTILQPSPLHVSQENMTKCIVGEEVSRII